ncbi:hypothetical protein JX266_014205 [Neoarthrinium moseri]|nr:hypothetical protein JX266_014205 [Neoarthrinium moseri]
MAVLQPRTSQRTSGRSRIQILQKFPKWHTHREPELSPSTTCKERQGYAIQSLQEKVKVKFTGAQEQEILPDSHASTVIRTLEKGFLRLETLDYLDSYDVGKSFEVIQAAYRLKKDLEALARGLSEICRKHRSSAQVSNWKIRHIEKCIRFLHRRRGQAIFTASDYDGTKGSRRQEKGALASHKLVDSLVPDLGGAALLIFSASAATCFKFSEARDVDVISLVREVCQGILHSDARVACGTRLFNPALFLSIFLQENYEDLCKQLGLGNLSKLYPLNGHGLFLETTLVETMAILPSPRVEEPLPEEPFWIIRGSHNAGSINKQAGTIMGKRKRIDDTTVYADRASQVRHTDAHLELEAPRPAKQAANYDSLASHVRLTLSDTDTLAEDDAATDHSYNHGDAGASVRREGPSAEQVRPGMPPCTSGSSAPSAIPNHETMAASVPLNYSESVNVGDRGSDVPTVATSNRFTRPKSPMGDNGDWNLDGFLSTLSTQISPADMNMFDLGVGDLMSGFSPLPERTEQE